MPADKPLPGGKAALQAQGFRNVDFLTTNTAMGIVLGATVITMFWVTLCVADSLKFKKDFQRGFRNIKHGLRGAKQAKN